MRTQQVAQRDLVNDPRLREFLLSALKTCPFVLNAYDAAVEVAQSLANPDVCLSVVCRAELAGLVLLYNQTGAFQPGISVTHIYNRGGADIRRALVGEIDRFARARGASCVWGVDVNQRPSAYERLFAKWKPTPRGIVYSYLVTEPPNGHQRELTFGIDKTTGAAC